jgi:(2Fe-2S) ferredoxin
MPADLKGFRFRFTPASCVAVWRRALCLTSARRGGRTLRMPVRRRYLFVCTNRRPDDNPKGSCAAKGAVAVHDALKQQLFQRNLAKVEARACTASCLDQCATGVSILVEPDHFFYGRVTVEDVPEIVDAVANGSRVERLVLDREDLDRG